jgi:hypothetical protein
VCKHLCGRFVCEHLCGRFVCKDLCGRFVCKDLCEDLCYRASNLMRRGFCFVGSWHMRG